MKKFYYILFIIQITEIVLGGGGRIFIINGIPLRMIIFSIITVLSLSYLLTNRFNKSVILISLFYSFYLLVYIIIGVINGAPINYIYEDISPLLYGYSFIFLYLISANYNTFITITIKIIKYSALLMSYIYIIVLLLFYLDQLNFENTYKLLSPTNEFFYRNGLSIYYKGFVFLPIAFLIFFKDRQYHHASIIILCIFFSFTRSLFLITFLCLLLYYFKKKELYVFLIILSISFLFFYQEFSNLFQTIFIRTSSDNYRIIQLNEVINMMNYISVFFGHGFGIGTPTRPIHMEIVYLEILHKQGIIGLIVFIIPIFFLYTNTFQKNQTQRIIGITGICLYFQSLFNAYLLNPIGITFIILNILVYFKNKNDKRLFSSI